MKNEEKNTRLSDKLIERAIEMGCKRWTKDDKDRLYISPYIIGYGCNRYKTGNISDAWLDDDPISNSEMNRVLGVKSYIDIPTGKLVIGWEAGRCNSDYKGAINEFYEALLEND